ncbi:MAG: hypothetical protein AAF589_06155 [Planctomycetota bacterium]
MLIEVAPETPWAKPGDLTFDEAVALLTSPVVPEENGGQLVDVGYFEKPCAVRLVAMADGAAFCLSRPLEERVARALLTADGGETIVESDWRQSWDRELDVAKIARHVIFVVVSLLPSGGMFRPGRPSGA